MGQAIAAPRSMEELREAVRRARSGAAPCLSTRTLAALVLMLQNPDRAAVLGISQLGKELGVDPSTLTRLGQRLGFSGFNELQDLFRGHVAARGTFYSDQTQNLIQRSPLTKRCTAEQLLEEEIQRLRETAADLQDCDVERAAGFICEAQSVYVLGLRATYAAAYFAGAFSAFLRRQVTILGGPGSTLAEDLAQIASSDLFLALSFRPYTRQTVAACKAISARNIPIVAITDWGSPIEAERPRYVTLRTRAPYYFDSALSSIFLVEVLLSAVAQQLGPAAIEHLSAVEGMLNELSVEIQ